MTEIALEPILELAERRMMVSATVRLPSNGRRVLLTVFKRFPNGENGSPIYGWTLERSDATGAPGGVVSSSPEIRQYPRPEDAFWGAVDALRSANLGQPIAG